MRFGLSSRKTRRRWHYMAKLIDIADYQEGGRFFRVRQDIEEAHRRNQQTLEALEILSSTDRHLQGGLDVLAALEESAIVMLSTESNRPVTDALLRLIVQARKSWHEAHAPEKASFKL